MSKGQTTRRPRPRPGDVGALRRTLWAAIRDVEELIHEPNMDSPCVVTIDQQIRAVHALAALSGQYLKATDADELVARIEALESALEQNGDGK